MSFLCSCTRRRKRSESVDSQHDYYRRRSASRSPPLSPSSAPPLATPQVKRKFPTGISTTPSVPSDLEENAAVAVAKHSKDSKRKDTPASKSKDIKKKDTSKSKESKIKDVNIKNNAKEKDTTTKIKEVNKKDAIRFAPGAAQPMPVPVCEKRSFGTMTAPGAGEVTGYEQTILPRVRKKSTPVLAAKMEVTLTSNSKQSGGYHFDAGSSGSETPRGYEGSISSSDAASGSPRNASTQCGFSDFSDDESSLLSLGKEEDVYENTVSDLRDPSTDPGATGGDAWDAGFLQHDRIWMDIKSTLMDLISDKDSEAFQELQESMKPPDLTYCTVFRKMDGSVTHKAREDSKKAARHTFGGLPAEKVSSGSRSKLNLIALKDQSDLDAQKAKRESKGEDEMDYEDAWTPGSDFDDRLFTPDAEGSRFDFENLAPSAPAARSESEVTLRSFQGGTVSDSPLTIRSHGSDTSSRTLVMTEVPESVHKESLPVKRETTEQLPGFKLTDETASVNIVPLEIQGRKVQDNENLVPKLAVKDSDQDGVSMRESQTEVRLRQKIVSGTFERRESLHSAHAVREGTPIVQDLKAQKELWRHGVAFDGKDFDIADADLDNVDIDSMELEPIDTDRSRHHPKRVTRRKDTAPLRSFSLDYEKRSPKVDRKRPGKPIIIQPYSSPRTSQIPIKDHSKHKLKLKREDCIDDDSIVVTVPDETSIITPSHESKDISLQNVTAINNEQEPDVVETTTGLRSPGVVRSIIEATQKSDGERPKSGDSSNASETMDPNLSRVKNVVDNLTASLASRCDQIGQNASKIPKAIFSESKSDPITEDAKQRKESVDESSRRSSTDSARNIPYSKIPRAVSSDSSDTENTKKSFFSKKGDKKKEQKKVEMKKPERKDSEEKKIVQKKVENRKSEKTKTDKEVNEDKSNKEGIDVENRRDELTNEQQNRTSPEASQIVSSNTSRIGRLVLPGTPKKSDRVDKFKHQTSLPEVSPESRFISKPSEIKKIGKIELFIPPPEEDEKKNRKPKRSRNVHRFLPKAGIDSQSDSSSPRESKECESTPFMSEPEITGSIDKTIDTSLSIQRALSEASATEPDIVSTHGSPHTSLDAQILKFGTSFDEVTKGSPDVIVQCFSESPMSVSFDDKSIDTIARSIFDREDCRGEKLGKSLTVFSAGSTSVETVIQADTNISEPVSVDDNEINSRFSLEPIVDDLKESSTIVKSSAEQRADNVTDKGLREISKAVIQMNDIETKTDDILVKSRLSLEEKFDRTVGIEKDRRSLNEEKNSIISSAFNAVTDANTSATEETNETPNRTDVPIERAYSSVTDEMDQINRNSTAALDDAFNLFEGNAADVSTAPTDLFGDSIFISHKFSRDEMPEAKETIENLTLSAQEKIIDTITSLHDSVGSDGRDSYTEESFQILAESVHSPGQERLSREIQNVGFPTDKVQEQYDEILRQTSPTGFSEKSISTFASLSRSSSRDQSSTKKSDGSQINKDKFQTTPIDQTVKSVSSEIADKPIITVKTQLRSEERIPSIDLGRFHISPVSSVTTDPTGISKDPNRISTGKQEVSVKKLGKQAATSNILKQTISDAILPRQLSDESDTSFSEENVPLLSADTSSPPEAFLPPKIEIVTLEKESNIVPEVVQSSSKRISVGFDAVHQLTKTETSVDETPLGANGNQKLTTEKQTRNPPVRLSDIHITGSVEEAIIELSKSGSSPRLDRNRKLETDIENNTYSVPDTVSNLSDSSFKEDKIFDKTSSEKQGLTKPLIVGVIDKIPIEITSEKSVYESGNIGSPPPLPPVDFIFDEENFISNNNISVLKDIVSDSPNGPRDQAKVSRTAGESAFIPVEGNVEQVRNEITDTEIALIENVPVVNLELQDTIKQINAFIESEKIFIEREQESIKTLCSLTPVDKSSNQGKEVDIDGVTNLPVELQQETIDAAKGDQINLTVRKQVMAKEEHEMEPCLQTEDKQEETCGRRQILEKEMTATEDKEEKDIALVEGNVENTGGEKKEADKKNKKSEKKVKTKSSKTEKSNTENKTVKKKVSKKSQEEAEAITQAILDRPKLKATRPSTRMRLLPKSSSTSPENSIDKSSESLESVDHITQEIAKDITLPSDLPSSVTMPDNQTQKISEKATDIKSEVSTTIISKPPEIETTLTEQRSNLSEDENIKAKVSKTQQFEIQEALSTPSETAKELFETEETTLTESVPSDKGMLVEPLKDSDAKDKSDETENKSSKMAVQSSVVEKRQSIKSQSSREASSDSARESTPTKEKKKGFFKQRKTRNSSASDSDVKSGDEKDRSSRTESSMTPLVQKVGNIFNSMSSAVSSFFTDAEAKTMEERKSVPKEEASAVKAEEEIGMISDKNIPKSVARKLQSEECASVPPSVLLPRENKDLFQSFSTQEETRNKKQEIEMPRGNDVLEKESEKKVDIDKKTDTKINDSYNNNLSENVNILKTIDILEPIPADRKKSSPDRDSLEDNVNRLPTDAAQGSIVSRSPRDSLEKELARKTSSVPSVNDSLDEMHSGRDSVLTLDSLRRESFSEAVGKEKSKSPCDSLDNNRILMESESGPNINREITQKDEINTTPRDSLEGSPAKTLEDSSKNEDISLDNVVSEEKIMNFSSLLSPRISFQESNKSLEGDLQVGAICSDRDTVVNVTTTELCGAVLAAAPGSSNVVPDSCEHHPQSKLSEMENILPEKVSSKSQNKSVPRAILSPSSSQESAPRDSIKPFPMIARISLEDGSSISSASPRDSLSSKRDSSTTFSDSRLSTTDTGVIDEILGVSPLPKDWDNTTSDVSPIHSPARVSLAVEESLSSSTSPHDSIELATKIFHDSAHDMPVMNGKPQSFPSNVTHQDSIDLELARRISTDTFSTSLRESFDSGGAPIISQQEISAQFERYFSSFDPNLISVRDSHMSSGSGGSRRSYGLGTESDIDIVDFSEPNLVIDTNLHENDMSEHKLQATPCSTDTSTSQTPRPGQVETMLSGDFDISYIDTSSFERDVTPRPNTESEPSPTREVAKVMEELASVLAHAEEGFELNPQSQVRRQDSLKEDSDPWSAKDASEFTSGKMDAFFEMDSDIWSPREGEAMVADDSFIGETDSFEAMCENDREVFRKIAEGSRESGVDLDACFDEMVDAILSPRSSQALDIVLDSDECKGTADKKISSELPGITDAETIARQVDDVIGINTQIAPSDNQKVKENIENEKRNNDQNKILESSLPSTVVNEDNTISDLGSERPESIQYVCKDNKINEIPEIRESRFDIPKNVKEIIDSTTSVQMEKKSDGKHPKQEKVIVEEKLKTETQESDKSSETKELPQLTIEVDEAHVDIDSSKSENVCYKDTCVHEAELRSLIQTHDSEIACSSQVEETKEKGNEKGKRKETKKTKGESKKKEDKKKCKQKPIDSIVTEIQENFEIKTGAEDRSKETSPVTSGDNVSREFRNVQIAPNVETTLLIEKTIEWPGNKNDECTLFPDATDKNTSVHTNGEDDLKLHGPKEQKDIKEIQVLVPEGRIASETHVKDQPYLSPSPALIDILSVDKAKEGNSTELIADKDEIGHTPKQSITESSLPSITTNQLLVDLKPSKASADDDDDFIIESLLDIDEEPATDLQTNAKPIGITTKQAHDSYSIDTIQDDSLKQLSDSDDDFVIEPIIDVDFQPLSTAIRTDKAEETEIAEVPKPAGDIQENIAKQFSDLIVNLEEKSIVQSKPTTCTELEDANKVLAISVSEPVLEPIATLEQSSIVQIKPTSEHISVETTKDSKTCSGSDDDEFIIEPLVDFEPSIKRDIKTKVVEKVIEEVVSNVESRSILGDEMSPKAQPSEEVSKYETLFNYDVPKEVPQSEIRKDSNTPTYSKQHSDPKTKSHSREASESFESASHEKMPECISTMEKGTKEFHEPPNTYNFENSSDKISPKESIFAPCEYAAIDNRGVDMKFHEKRKAGDWSKSFSFESDTVAGNSSKKDSQSSPSVQVASEIRSVIVHEKSWSDSFVMQPAEDVSVISKRSDSFSSLEGVSGDSIPKQKSLKKPEKRSSKPKCSTGSETDSNVVDNTFKDSFSLSTVQNIISDDSFANKDVLKHSLKSRSISEEEEKDIELSPEVIDKILAFQHGKEINSDLLFEDLCHQDDRYSAEQFSSENDDQEIQLSAHRDIDPSIAELNIDVSFIQWSGPIRREKKSRKTVKTSTSRSISLEDPDDIVIDEKLTAPSGESNKDEINELTSEDILPEKSKNKSKLKPTSEEVRASLERCPSTSEDESKAKEEKRPRSILKSSSREEVKVELIQTFDAPLRQGETSPSTLKTSKSKSSSKDDSPKISPTIRDPFDPFLVSREEEILEDDVFEKENLKISKSTVNVGELRTFETDPQATKHESFEFYLSDKSSPRDSVKRSSTKSVSFDDEVIIDSIPPIIDDQIQSIPDIEYVEPCKIYDQSTQTTEKPRKSKIERKKSPKKKSKSKYSEEEGSCSKISEPEFGVVSEEVALHPEDRYDYDEFKRHSLSLHDDIIQVPRIEIHDAEIEEENIPKTRIERKKSPKKKSKSKMSDSDETNTGTQSPVMFGNYLPSVSEFEIKETMEKNESHPGTIERRRSPKKKSKAKTSDKITDESFATSERIQFEDISIVPESQIVDVESVVVENTTLERKQSTKKKSKCKLKEDTDSIAETVSFDIDDNIPPIPDVVISEAASEEIHMEEKQKLKIERRKSPKKSKSKNIDKELVCERDLEEILISIPEFENIEPISDRNVESMDQLNSSQEKTTKPKIERRKSPRKSKSKHVERENIDNNLSMDNRDIAVSDRFDGIEERVPKVGVHTIYVGNVPSKSEMQRNMSEKTFSELQSSIVPSCSSQSLVDDSITIPTVEIKKQEKTPDKGKQKHNVTDNVSFKSKQQTHSERILINENIDLPKISAVEKKRQTKPADVSKVRFENIRPVVPVRKRAVPIPVSAPLRWSTSLPENIDVFREIANVDKSNQKPTTQSKEDLSTAKESSVRLALDVAKNLLRADLPGRRREKSKSPRRHPEVETPKPEVVTLKPEMLPPDAPPASPSSRRRRARAKRRSASTATAPRRESGSIAPPLDWATEVDAEIPLDPDEDAEYEVTTDAHAEGRTGTSRRKRKRHRRRRTAAATTPEAAPAPIAVPEVQTPQATPLPPGGRFKRLKSCEDDVPPSHSSTSTTVSTTISAATSPSTQVRRRPSSDRPLSPRSSWGRGGGTSGDDDPTPWCVVRPRRLRRRQPTPTAPQRPRSNEGVDGFRFQEPPAGVRLSSGSDGPADIFYFAAAEDR